MKRALYITTTLLIFLAPVYTSAKDSGPVTAKIEPKKEAPASQPASAPVKTDIEISGKIKITKEPASASDAGALITDVIIAFKSGKFWYGISLILMLLTFVLGLIKKDIPPHLLPWIAAAIGIATNSVAAIVGGMVWWEAIVSGLFQGAAAAGFWSMIGKHILLSRVDKGKRDKAREIAAQPSIKVAGETNNGD